MTFGTWNTKFHKNRCLWGLQSSWVSESSKYISEVKRFLLQDRNNHISEYTDINMKKNGILFHHTTVLGCSILNFGLFTSKFNWILFWKSRYENLWKLNLYWTRIMNVFQANCTVFFNSGWVKIRSHWEHLLIHWEI